MDKSALTALVALVGTLSVGFASTFLAEHYRRFRDRGSLAGAIAGELASYSEAWPILNDQLSKMIVAFENGAVIKLPKLDKPTDRVFDSCVAQIGLLGPDLAEATAYVYNNINAFRVAFIASSDPEISNIQQAQLIKNALAALNRANDRGSDLPKKLRTFANESYFYKLPHLVLGLIFLAAIAFGSFFLGLTFKGDCVKTEDSPRQVCLVNSHAVAASCTCLTVPNCIGQIQYFYSLPPPQYCLTGLPLGSN